jgi:PKD repeat protein
MMKTIGTFSLLLICCISLFADLNNGLVAHYPFNGNAHDESVSGNNLTNFGAQLCSDRFGNINSAYEFSGNEYMRLLSRVVPNTGDFTVNVWAKANTVQSGYREVLSHSSNSSNLYFGKTPLNEIRIGDDWQDTGINFPLDNLWHFYTIIKNSSNTFLFVDSELVATREDSIQNPQGTNLEFRIGRQYGSNNEYFLGKIDDIRIYNRSLSEPEIHELYHEGGYPTLETGLVAFYPFNGNANDESGNGNDGVVYEAILTNDRLNNSLSAYNFDISDATGWGNANDRIVVPYNSSLAVENITLAAWVNPNYKQPPYDDRLSICSRWTDGITNEVFRFQIEYDSNEIQFRLLNDSNGQHYIASGGNVPFNQWSFVVATYDGSSVKLYVNSNLVNTEYFGFPMSQGQSKLTIGETEMSNGHWNYWSGDLDELHYYNRALSESEIIELYGFRSNFTSFESSYIGEEIQLTDTSFGNIDNWSWDFQNDGVYDSFEQNPTFTYTEVGTYDVKLKISNATMVDSLIKQDYITVTYCPPVAPDNVEVDIVYPDANISWTAVDTTECGSVITPDGYIVLYSEDETEYLFLNYTTQLSYVHTYVAQFRPQMFYQVVAFKDFSREQLAYLEGLNFSIDQIRWGEVKKSLEIINKSLKLSE